VTVSQNLSVGLVVTQRNVLDDLVMEMLEHLGIEYEIVEPTTSRRKHPAVLISRSSPDSMFVAKQHSLLEENIISVDEIVRFDSVLSLLSGTDQRAGDQFDLLVNGEEQKLRGSIKSAFKRLDLPFVFKWYWPGFKPACCVLTHDIDWLTYSPLHKAVFRGPMKPSKSLKLVKSGLLKDRDFGWNIPSTVELEKKYGARSTFFFLTRYEADTLPIFRESLELLKRNDFEIALHGYRASHKNMESLNSELATFKDNTGLAPAGLRYHVLKFRVPDSWLLEVKAGLKYDATFAYNEFFGFRGGICFPYHPFNDSRLPIVEIPTGFMDWTALKRGLRGSKLNSKIEETRELVEKFHGAFVVNFHNTYLNPETFEDVYSAYENILKSVTSRNYWICTAKECAEWWEYRSSTKLDPIADPSGNVTVSSKSNITLVQEKADSAVEEVKAIVA